MSKSIRTIYRNGQIELPPEVQLPDNTLVTVILPDDLPEDAAPDPAFSIPDSPLFFLTWEGQPKALST